MWIVKMAERVFRDYKLIIIIISIYGMQRRCAILENCTRQPLYRWPDVNQVTWRSETPHRVFVEQLFQCLLCWFSPSYYCSKFYSSSWVLDGACMRLTPLLLCGCIIKKTRILLHVSYKVLMAVYKKLIFYYFAVWVKYFLINLHNVGALPSGICGKHALTGFSRH